MTDTVEVQPVKLEDLNYFWTTSGLPCFYANRDNIEDIVESLGFNIYYLICNIAEDKKVTTSTTTYTNGVATTSPQYTTELTTGIVKVVNNIVGRSVSAVSDDISELTPIRESGAYHMPAIPRIIVDKLDEFFRLVDAQHGTESIVLLTFDPSKDDSSGWGVLVPDQTNTAVHCNYNPDSIVEEKPDNVLIVGSVHSHPGMAAYASGTDHSDQADFDGLHITYGWQKTVNNGATQYHIEMQMSGTSWTLKPEDVFETFSIKKEPDPDVVEWSGKVKKALPPLQSQAGVYTTSPATPPAPYRPAPQTTPTTGLGTHKQSKPDIKTNGNYILVAEIDPAVESLPCPNCDHITTAYDMQVGYCKVCDIPFVSAGDTIDEIMIQIKWYLNCRYISEDTIVYLWSKDPSIKEEIVMNVGTVKFLNDTDTEFIYTSKESDNKTVLDYSEDSFYDSDLESFDPDLTVCCGTNILNGNCTCELPVLYEDTVDFEDAHDGKDIYDWTSKCLECKFYSGPGCRDYVDAVIDYATNRNLLKTTIKECDSFQNYRDFDSYAETTYRGYL
jgi:hypothetical protein